MELVNSNLDVANYFGPVKLFSSGIAKMKPAI